MNGLEQHLEAGRERGSRLNDEIDELLPEALADDPALDDLLADSGQHRSRDFRGADLALVQSAEDDDELGELELGGEVSTKINNPVRTYLREIGTASLLTREGEIDLARRMERGQTRVKKALSRAPLVIQEMLKLGQALEQDRVSVRDVLIVPDSNGTDSSGTEQKEQLLQRIAEIAKHYEEAQQLHQQLQAVSRRLEPRRHRMLWYNFAVSLVRLSRDLPSAPVHAGVPAQDRGPDRASGRAVQTGRVGGREDPAESGGERASLVGRVPR